jgi:hypothetical protein
MMTLANVESRRITELLAAFEEHEITTHEFSDCLERLSAEALFVVANFSTGSEDISPVSDRLRFARQICRQHATACRSYC